ncbi:MAG: DUF3095 domain-containing protein [Deltaproteobacteria bacterium]|nr:DUF3095 domain-containing protein [Deltaproteobacteria bacterium]
MAAGNEDFYALLDEISEFDEVVTASLHRPVPDDWHVVISDVRGSTAAIEAGRYRDVNALGVAGIVALRNAMPDLDLPYVFGGDGATLLVPGSRITAVQTALRGLRNVARDAFTMNLRVSHVPVAELRRQGHPLAVGRYRLSRNVVLAAFSGSGFSTAETWIKDPVIGQGFAVSAEGPAEANLSGFECRWQPVASQRGSVVSLLVVATGQDPVFRESTYHEILREIASVVGDAPTKPVTADNLKLKTLTGDFSTEARLRTGATSGPAYARAHRAARNAAVVGRGLMSLGLKFGAFNGATYKREVLENTDFRKFDEALRMILDLRAEEIETLDRYLAGRHEAGDLCYGMHQSGEALVTCMVGSYSGNHVHFVDGANGGYALAAKPLKEQLKAIRDPNPI